MSDHPPIYYKKVTRETVMELAYLAARRATKRGWLDGPIDDAVSAAVTRALRVHVNAPWLSSLKFLTAWIRWWASRDQNKVSSNNFVHDVGDGRADPKQLAEARELLNVLPGDLREIVVRAFWLGETAQESCAALYISKAEYDRRMEDALIAMRWAR